MKLVNITKRLMGQYGVPADSVVNFSIAIDRIFDDGKNALDERQDISAKADLVFCQDCVLVEIQSRFVILGDDWEKSKNSKNPNKSVDIIAQCLGDGHLFLLPIEGKLGMSFDYQGAKAASSLSLKDLEEKYDGCSRLLRNSSQLATKLVVVVPANGQEWMWYKIRNWNRIKNKIGKIFSCCPSDLLTLLGLCKSTKPDKCKTNVYRTQLLQSEFDKIGAMSNVQLPPHDSCVGCGNCKIVCKDVVKRFAISMIPDDDLEDSPLRPYVDEMSCKSGCRECEKVCPILHPLN